MALNFNEQKERMPLRLNFPQFAPYKMCGEYFISKSETYKTTQAFAWDKPRYDPQIDLTIAIKDLYESENELEHKREEQIARREDLKKQWDNLEKKELELRENFSSLSDFVRINFEKKARAQVKIETERLRVEQRSKDIIDLKEKIEKLEEAKAHMDEKTQLYKMYEKFLDQTVAASNGEFKFSMDVINRYESLMAAKKTLADRQEKALAELEMARTRMAKLVEDNTFLLLGLNNTVSSLNSRYQTAKSKSQHWECVVQDIRKHAFERYREICEVRQSAYNIYLLMCKRKQMAPEFNESDFENHLIFIKKTLEELHNIDKMVQMQAKKRITSTKVEFSKSSG